MLGQMRKLKSLVIVVSCVLSTVAILPGTLFAETAIEEWVARYNGPGNSYDITWVMAADSLGNVYVTGGSDGSGTGRDYATIKYDPNGTQLWEARYNGAANSSDSANAIAVDSLGNVYVTGGSYGSGTGRDYATIKYDPTGTQLWKARYNGPGDSHDDARAIAVDTSGNVYVTGDRATVKYDADGNEIWVALGYLGETIALDSVDNVYVMGSNGTVKYDTSGNELWVARYTVSGCTTAPQAMAVDSLGNVYVAGYSYGICANNHDFFTVKYDTNGNDLWVATYDGPLNGSDAPEAIAVDTSGNVYVAGYSVGIDTHSDFAMIKYDPDGTELWVARYNGPENTSDHAYAIAVDTSGNIYLTGYVCPLYSENYDCATVKFDASGTELWSALYVGPGNDRDIAYDIAVDTSSNVYVTGQSIGSGTNYDYLTIKYSQTADPIKLLLVLAQDVIELNLQNGIENSLDAKLSAALGALQDVNENNNGAAINTLQAFINAVEAQRGDKIPNEADANALIDIANEIIVLLQNGYY